MARLIDEVQTIGLDGLKVAGRVQRLEGLARDAALTLHRRYLDKKV